MSEEITLTLRLEIIKNNPSKSLNNYLKSIYNFRTEYDKKMQHICQHEGCEGPSCGSHEISNGIFLSPFSDEDENVYMLGINFSGNAFELKIKPVKARYATVFGGYCSRHDDELFSSFENSNFSMNSDFLHKQALRTIRKEIYLLDSHLLKLKSVQEELLGDDIPRHLLLRLARMILRIKLTLGKYWDFYSKLWSAISKKEEFIYYREIQLPQKQVAFSGAYANRHKVRPPYLFLFVLPGETNRLVLAVPVQYRDDVDWLFDLPEERFFEFINDRICEKLDRLVFSKSYYDELGTLEKRALSHEPQFGNNLAIRMANLLR